MKRQSENEKQNKTLRVITASESEKFQSTKQPRDKKGTAWGVCLQIHYTLFKQHK